MAAKKKPTKPKAKAQPAAPKKPESPEGYFGEFGGRFVSELLIPALDELNAAWKKFSHDKKFEKELLGLYNDYAGRPSLLTYAANLSERYKAQIYLKREDLLHTGSHKINNTLGQALLAQKMKKKRIIAETGAGQHGVATATAAALMKIPAHIYMGSEDLRRQALNGFRMRLLGSTVAGVGGEHHQPLALHAARLQRQQPRGVDAAARRPGHHGPAARAGADDGGAAYQRADPEIWGS